MTKSTIENIDTINVEEIATDKLEEILKGVNKEIEKLEKDRYIILSELARRD